MDSLICLTPNGTSSEGAHDQPLTLSAVGVTENACLQVAFWNTFHYSSFKCPLVAGHPRLARNIFTFLLQVGQPN